jgi:anhydro-N-acetylmuramic acid kinase
MSSYNLIGVMSGTSLDGVDLACVHFELRSSEHEFTLVHSSHFSFPEDLFISLKAASTLSPQQLIVLDKEFGRFLGKCVLNFVDKFDISIEKIDAIASHGQTIFHQPNEGFTLQIGCGSSLALTSGIPVINDFRTRDILAGGQGAPLVPIGDFGLFSSMAEAFVNIGGFVNMSYRHEKNVRAFDVCPGNLPLNLLAANKGLSFDKDGYLASTGEINFFLLDMLNSLDYYHQTGPKSLGVEWLEEYFYPLVKFDKEIENNLRTIVEHIAIQLGTTLNELGVKNALFTGGGARNKFLMERIKHYFNGEVRIPSDEVIDFKEAIVFAYLGALYLDKQVNCLSSVTGAKKDVIGGVYHIVG